MEDSLQHQGLMMHRAIGGAVLRLGAIRNGISPANAGQTLAVLRRMERNREPIEITRQREQAWEERALNWRARLGRFSGRGARTVRIVGGDDFDAAVFAELDRVKHVWFRLLIAELALRVFHDQHGRYPHDLKELVPQYLDSVPLDPFSDQALVYQLQGEKYRLYSIWANRLDDHGKIGRCDFREILNNQSMDADLDTSITTNQQTIAAGVAAAKGPAKTSGAKPTGAKSAAPMN